MIIKTQANTDYYIDYFIIILTSDNYVIFNLAW